jgi:hypothetical protein
LRVNDEFVEVSRFALRIEKGKYLGLVHCREDVSGNVAKGCEAADGRKCEELAV